MTTRRKLAAILSADVAGYSRLMAADEAGTLRALNHARAVFKLHIDAHQGRIVDTAGDSVPAEFDSAVEAVSCAVDLQNALAAENEALPESRRMRFRIGVNLGDVIEEDAALYGDGVNVAARLQALAEPGGLCISGTVYDQVEGKLPLAFEYAGKQAVKNIPKPVRNYRLASGPTPAGKRRPALLAAAALTLAALSAVALWWQARARRAPGPEWPAPTRCSGGVRVELPAGRPDLAAGSREYRSGAEADRPHLAGPVLRLVARLDLWPARAPGRRLADPREVEGNAAGLAAGHLLRLPRPARRRSHHGVDGKGLRGPLVGRDLDQEHDWLRPDPRFQALLKKMKPDG
jgi:class 3 adenylate cyclase